MAHSFQNAGFDLKRPRIAKYLELCMRIQDLPRHLGQHSGGMLICMGKLNQVVPLERASMPGRTVVQWDKEDCADLGIIKGGSSRTRHDGRAQGLPGISSKALR
jgi:error-prone DNA polymerase